MNKKSIKTHTQNLEKAHDILEQNLPYYEGSFWAKWGRIGGAILILGIFAFGAWKVITMEEKLPDAPVEPPVITQPDPPVVIEPAEPIEPSEPEIEIVTRASVRSFVAGEQVAEMPIRKWFDVDAGLRAMVSGWAIGENLVANFVKMDGSLDASRVGIILSDWIGLDSRASLGSVRVSGKLVKWNQNYTDRAAELTAESNRLAQISEVNKFVSVDIVNPPSELEHVRDILVLAQTNTFSAIEEVRQIEIFLKEKYQIAKMEVDALSNELAKTVNSGEAPNVSEQTRELQLKSAAMSAFQVEFGIYQQLEKNLRATAVTLREKIEYIDENYNDIALGLCDWQTC